MAENKFRFEILLRILCLAFLISLLSSNILALSCVGKPESEVKVIQNSSNDKIKFSSSHSFESSKVRKNGFYSFSEYERIALDTLNGKVHRNLSESMEIKKIDQGVIKESEAVISGPPRRACGYTFEGFVDNKEGMQAAIIDGSFESYRYRGTFINSSAGKNVSCGDVKYPDCSVSVEFQIGEEEFEIKPNQTYMPDSDMVEKVKLLEANKNFDWEWGTETYSNYVIYFSPENGERMNQTDENAEENSKNSKDSFVKKVFLTVLSFWK